ncbi:hypothetical protein D3C74_366720 [compost metagenome]
MHAIGIHVHGDIDWLALLGDNQVTRFRSSQRLFGSCQLRNVYLVGSFLSNRVSGSYHDAAGSRRALRSGTAVFNLRIVVSDDQRNYQCDNNNDGDKNAKLHEK